MKGIITTTNIKTNKVSNWYFIIIEQENIDFYIKMGYKIETFTYNNKTRKYLMCIQLSEDWNNTIVYKTQHSPCGIYDYLCDKCVVWQYLQAIFDGYLELEQGDFDKAISKLLISAEMCELPSD